MGRYVGRRGPTARGFVWAAAAAGLIAACSSSSTGGPPAGQNADVTKAIASLATGDWNGALASCLSAEAASSTDCDAQYCEFIARSMLVVNEINTFLLPRYRRPLTPMPGDVESLATTNMLLDSAITSGEAVTTHQCEFNLPTLPLKLGDADDPVVDGEVRGRWTTRDAHIMTALFDSISYGLQAEFNPQPVPAPPAGDTVPALPPLLDSMRQHLLSQDSLLLSEPANPDPTNPRGGWLDRNGNGKPDSADELLIDIFKPGTSDRIFDFSTAEFVRGEPLPVGVLTPTANLPPARCGYRQFHIDDVATGSNVTSTDGMSFSPDGTQIAIPLIVSGKTQIHTANVDGTNVNCITCTQTPLGNNDGVRWRPGTGDTMIFISDRDHPHATGNAGGGFGQELYAMKADGTQPTRLTTSDLWATNYHVNWSPDGAHIVWGRTEARTWDVMVADFVVDADGTMRLDNTRTLVHDTTWWETHGFTADNKYVITTNTRMGFQSTDLYAVDVATGLTRTRLTDNAAWDEHAHLSPDGRQIAWISGRWNPASVIRLNDGSITPTYDFMWIFPGIFFEFLHPPAGYSSELTLMDADGMNVRALTTDQQVVADSQWSFDGTKIIFRETDSSGQSTRIRVLTFDDCTAPAPTSPVTL
jgi:Tol biopolymer transport system component